MVNIYEHQGMDMVSYQDYLNLQDFVEDLEAELCEARHELKTLKRRIMTLVEDFNCD